jgi:N-acetylglucosamine-6-phosphate deacetylase
VPRTLLTGADLVLADRVASGHTLVIDDDRITEVLSGPQPVRPEDDRIDLSGHLIVPGFIDLHVHGVNGCDVLDGPGSVAAIAADLPRWGVTAFCPTTVACTPDALRGVLDEIRRLRATPPPGAARVLPAHLESNFLNPDYRGAQPLSCLRPPRAAHAGAAIDRGPGAGRARFDAEDILAEIDRRRPDVATVTVAPELDGGLDLIRRLTGAGIRVSLGHSGATFDQAQAAIAAGACQATHLFNRMSPMTHRDPGLVGAMLASDDIAAEIICDGEHVHPSVIGVAIAAKGVDRVIAITDGTAGSGLPAGTRAMLGGQPITVGDVARLDDGTMAGSVLTMNRAFACLVSRVGIGLVDAVRLTSTTPASELRLRGHGVIAAGAVADLVVLDATLDVVQTWIGGRAVYTRA